LLGFNRQKRVLPQALGYSYNLRSKFRIGDTMQVEVYRNLHTGNWSIRSAKSGRVVDHADTVYITGAK